MSGHNNALPHSILCSRQGQQTTGRQTKQVLTSASTGTFCTSSGTGAFARSAITGTCQSKGRPGSSACTQATQVDAWSTGRPGAALQCSAQRALAVFMALLCSWLVPWKMTLVAAAADG